MSATHVEYTIYVIYVLRSKGGDAPACLAGIDRDPEKLLVCDLDANCSTGRAIPESQLTAHAAATGILLQTCRLVSTIVKPSFPRRREIVLCFRDHLSRFTWPADSLLTHRSKPQHRSQKFGTVSDTAIPNWQDACSTVPRILGHAMPTQGCGKGSRRKKPSSLTAHHGEFDASTPYWHPQCTRAVGPRVAQCRSQSGIPDGAAL